MIFLSVFIINTVIDLQTKYDQCNSLLEKKIKNR